MFAELWEKLRLSPRSHQKLHENMRYYVQQATKAQEEERLRIARELHDSTAQSLIAVLHQLESFMSRSKYLKMADSRELWKIAEQIKEVLQEVRQFSRDLRPSILDDLGLIPAVEWLVEGMKEHKIQGRLEVKGEEKRFLPETEIVLFRIIQEALRNVTRHAQGKNAWVSIEFGEEYTRVTIKDDGRGFSLPHSLGELPRFGKLGLIGMQERAELIGGNLDIISHPHQGTVVTVTIPVEGNIQGK